MFYMFFLFMIWYYFMLFCFLVGGSQLCEWDSLQFFILISRSSIHPGLHDFQVNEVLLWDWEWIMVQNHEICFFVHLDGSNDILQIALPGCIDRNCFKSFIGSHTFFLIQNLTIVSHCTSNCIVNAPDWINWLTIVIWMDGGSQPKLYSWFHGIH